LLLVLKQILNKKTRTNWDTPSGTSSDVNVICEQRSISCLVE